MTKAFEALKDKLAKAGCDVTDTAPGEFVAVGASRGGEFPSPYLCPSRISQATPICNRFGIDAAGKAWILSHLDWAEDRAAEFARENDAYWSNIIE